MAVHAQDQGRGPAVEKVNLPYLQDLPAVGIDGHGASEIDVGQPDLLRLPLQPQGAAVSGNVDAVPEINNRLFTAPDVKIAAARKGDVARAGVIGILLTFPEHHVIQSLAVRAGGVRRVQRIAVQGQAAAETVVTGKIVNAHHSSRGRPQHQSPCALKVAAFPEIQAAGA